MHEESAHRFLRASETLPQVGFVNKLAAYVINHIAGTDRSVSSLRKQRRLQLVVQDTPKTPLRNVLLDFEAFACSMRELRTIPFEDFNLPRPQSPFFDSPLALARNFHVLQPHHTEAIVLRLGTPLGKNFPIYPALDREGVAFTSFQGQIQKNIISLVREVIGRSDLAVTINADWLNTLRMMINDCISLIEITLHQLHCGAEYGVKSRWKFDQAQLGMRHGRRLSDKLKWVGLICGRALDDVQQEVIGFNELREVRNHFNHFDPPCIAMSVEDVARWCNRVPEIARLAWRIRDRAGEQITPELVELMLTPIVEFSPRDDLPRFPAPPECGYQSSKWPSGGTP